MYEILAIGSTALGAVLVITALFVQKRILREEKQKKSEQAAGWDYIRKQGPCITITINDGISETSANIANTGNKRTDVILQEITDTLQKQAGTTVETDP